MNFVLDIGSSSLRLLAVTNVCKRAKIVAEESLLYDGFLDGEFLSEDKLEGNLNELIMNLSSKIKRSITSVTVGVPNDFCICVCKRIKRSFVTLHKISKTDLLNLYEYNMTFGESESYSVINYSPMQFVLDGDFKTMSPVGKKTSMLIADVSYILAKNSFIDLISEKLKSLKVKDIDFVSTTLAQGSVCETKSGDKKPFILVDCGHITTSVSVFKGEGLALMSSFSMGGGHISSDIMQVLNLGFKEAELIKRKVVLTIDSRKNDQYLVRFKGENIKAPINITNQIVKSRIEMIAKTVDNILSIDDYFKDLDIYITGDGLSNFKGVKNIFKNVTNREIYDFKIPFDSSKDKFQTSKYGLMSLLEVIE